MFLRMNTSELRVGQQERKECVILRKINWLETAVTVNNPKTRWFQYLFYLFSICSSFIPNKIYPAWSREDSSSGKREHFQLYLLNLHINHQINMKIRDI